ncbi:MAG: DMT family transporter [Ignavibacteria bacterium]
MLGEFFALITAILWSMTSLFFASAVVRIGSVQLNVTRQLIALFLLTSLIILTGVNFNLKPEQYFYLSLSGIVGLTFGDSFLFLAYREIGARISMLVMSLSPAIAALLAYFFLFEKISLIGIIGICITLTGIMIVVYEKNSSATTRINYVGLIFALFASIGQGTGLVLAKYAFNLSQNSINGFVATTIRLAASLMILFPISVLTGKFKNPIQIFSKDKKALWLTIGGSIAGPFLGITFSLISISHTKVGIASTIMALPPIIMLPMVKYFYNEKLSLRSIFGAFIAVAGVAILFLRN